MIAAKIHNLRHDNLEINFTLHELDEILNSNIGMDPHIR
jgi:hypothetical protein